jgi:hypothetical protein
MASDSERAIESSFEKATGNVVLKRSDGSTIIEFNVAEPAPPEPPEDEPVAITYTKNTTFPPSPFPDNMLTGDATSSNWFASGGVNDAFFASLTAGQHWRVDVTEPVCWIILHSSQRGKYLSRPMGKTANSY